MRRSDIVKLSLRTFKARVGRTVLTVLGMGIGIGAILFLVGLGYGLQELLLKAITTSDSLLALDITANPDQGANLSQEKIDQIKKIPGVEDVAPTFDFNAQLKYKDVATDASATVTKPLFLTLEGKKISLGTTLADGKTNGVILSTAFSKNYQEDPKNMLGQEVSFTLRVPNSNGTVQRENTTVDPGQKFKVVGFIESEEPAFYVSSETLGPLIPPMDYSRLKIKCANSAVIDGIKKQISDSGYSVTSLSETVAEVNKMFTFIKLILAFFGLVSLVVSAIGMFNTMTVALLERTKEIGIMKAIGASDFNILAMFILESTAMGFLGGICGIALGVIGGSAFNGIINVVASRMGGKSISLFSYPIWFILFIIGFSIFVGFITGIAPARRASSIDPLDALRSK